MECLDFTMLNLVPTGHGMTQMIPRTVPGPILLATATLKSHCHRYSINDQVMYRLIYKLYKKKNQK